MKQLQKNVYYEIGKKEDIKMYSRILFTIISDLKNTTFATNNSANSIAKSSIGYSSTSTF